MGRCQPPGVIAYDLHVNKEGRLFIRGVTDSTVEGALFPVNGKFKTGDEATQLLSGSSDAVIPFTLTAESKAGISSN